MNLPRLWLVLAALVITNTLIAGDLTSSKARACLSFYEDLQQTKPVPADTPVTVIPFDYKQSALYLPYTYQIIDSVANLLKSNKEITLTIYGYAHRDEGSDTIIKYLSLNRAIFVKDYILGRGISADRIQLVKGMGKQKPKSFSPNSDGKILNCRAEILLNYPPPPKVGIDDRDKDGIADADDHCPDVYGYVSTQGCPVEAVHVPFELKESNLYGTSYNLLDSMVSVLKENPTFSIKIEGHAYNEEGGQNFCLSISRERADIVKAYLLSRRVAASRIDAVEAFGNSRPMNAGDTPLKKMQNMRADIILNRH